MWSSLERLEWTRCGKIVTSGALTCWHVSLRCGGIDVTVMKLKNGAEKCDFKRILLKNPLRWDLSNIVWTNSDEIYQQNCNHSFGHRSSFPVPTRIRSRINEVINQFEEFAQPSSLNSYGKERKSRPIKTPKNNWQSSHTLRPRVHHP